MKCQYPDCKKKAEFSLGLNDPDSEPNYYCKEHCEKAKINTLMNLFDIKYSKKNRNI